jgi:hypothetical protein
MNGQLHERIYQHVKPGETVLWSGQPGPFHLAKWRIKNAVWSVVWLLIFVPLFYLNDFGGFFGPGLHWQTLFSVGNIPFFIGLGLLSVGVLSALSPVFAYLGAPGTVYVVTERRILMIGGLRSSSLRDYSLDKLGIPEVEMNRDGTGDVVFRREGRRSLPILFAGIRDPQTVASLVSGREVANAQESAARTSRLANGPFGFTLNVPSDWHTSLPEGAGAEQWSEVQVRNDRGADMRIAIKEEPLLPFDEVLQQMQTIVRSPVGQLISSRDDLNINGYKGYEFTYTMLKGMQIRQVILFGKIRQYHFIYSAPVNIFPVYENVFSNVLNSFENDRDLPDSESVFSKPA